MHTLFKNDKNDGDRIRGHPNYVFICKHHQAPIIVKKSGLIKWVEETL
jgi:hypothetical protein